jgi:hypothetical protein
MVLKIKKDAGVSAVFHFFNNNINQKQDLIPNQYGFWNKGLFGHSFFFRHINCFYIGSLPFQEIVPLIVLGRIEQYHAS